MQIMTINLFKHKFIVTKVLGFKGNLMMLSLSLIPVLEASS